MGQLHIFDSSKNVLSLQNGRVSFYKNKKKTFYVSMVSNLSALKITLPFFKRCSVTSNSKFMTKGRECDCMIKGACMHAGVIESLPDWAMPVFPSD